MPKQRELFLDIETHEAGQLYSLPPEEFVRLIGYAWDNGPVRITTNLEELRNEILEADRVVGHNIHAFDLKGIFGTKSFTPLDLTEERRVVDTWVHAPLYVQPPFWVTLAGAAKPTRMDEPEKLKKFYKLDELAHQLGVQGKTDDLKTLAREFGDPALTGKDRVKSGFGRIPLDDERYRDYLIGDVEATRKVYRALMEVSDGMSEYDWREQEIVSRFAVIQSNGIRVDKERAEARVQELAERRKPLVELMERKYGMPTEGAAPWATNPGKEAIFKALADHGITPESKPEWPKTDTGNPSLGGKELIALTEGTEAEDLGTTLAELKGQRSLAQLALDSMHSDGFAHPDITFLQKSGRSSVTDPGLTIWTARGPGAIEKAVFIPDSRGHCFIEADFSNADARAVASCSGDRDYAVRFEPGQDGHLINAVAAWGEELVFESDESRAYYRQRAKIPGHGWGYCIGSATLSKQVGMTIEEAADFLDGMNQAFPKVVAWQRRMAKEGQTTGFVHNHWGRRMAVEKRRAFTQAPALVGQSTTREIACDFVLRTKRKPLRQIKAFIHDAFLFSVPRGTWRQWRDYYASQMRGDMNPKGGQYMDFPVSFGTPGDNWHESHPD